MFLLTRVGRARSCAVLYSTWTVRPSVMRYVVLYSFLFWSFSNKLQVAFFKTTTRFSVTVKNGRCKTRTNRASRQTNDGTRCTRARRVESTTKPTKRQTARSCTRRLPTPENERTDTQLSRPAGGQLSCSVGASYRTVLVS